MGKKKGKSQPIGTKTDNGPPAIVAESPTSLKVQEPVKKTAPTPVMAEVIDKKPEPVLGETSDEPKKKKTTRGGKRNPNRRARLEAEAAAKAAEEAANVNDPSDEQQECLDIFQKKLNEVENEIFD